MQNFKQVSTKLFFSFAVYNRLEFYHKFPKRSVNFVDFGMFGKLLETCYGVAHNAIFYGQIVNKRWKTNGW